MRRAAPPIASHMRVTALGEPVPYMESTREYYRALGYTKDYVWATFADVPFMPLRKRLSATRIALITTANPPDYDGVRRLWCGSTASEGHRLNTVLNRSARCCT